MSDVVDTKEWELDGTEPVRDPEQDAARLRMAGKGYFVKGYVILGREPEKNSYTGWIEHSFSMGMHEERSRLWRKRSDGYEGLPGAEYNCPNRHHALTRGWPEPFKVWDIDDPECPIEIDWVWHENHLDKFESRNPKFFMRDMMEDRS